ncbi:uba ts-n domain containing protein [Grosmannia clavigera kw1407]|uniref:Uba ts-n domain containing protein n=1 Tax=Grosmannia clavigera (strain kw1407 / UAMH 11150) TaxID=655863 RepID=F0XKZ9_GROCL|nr:uba ts-n domain containing protein [Grosmannia clavigera kw1407]EFX01777.1 uba ts-n domain containing protein [Grosmannia clavigera kw1407]
MDDLSGLDWSAGSSATNKSSAKPTIAASSAAFSTGAFQSYPPLRPAPSPLASGRNTPLSSQTSGIAAGAAAPKPTAVAKPAQDSFSNLISFGSAKNPANLSLRERQELLETERRKKEEERRKQHEANYGNGQFFDVLARGSAGGASRTASPAADTDADLFAAFNANTKVDNSSHFPPVGEASRKSTPAAAAVSPPPGLDLSNPNAWNTNAPGGSVSAANDDDDPFGLNQLQSRPVGRPAVPPTSTGNVTGDGDDDDFLGDLGRPVEEVRRKAELQQKRHPHSEPGKPIEDSSSDSDAVAPSGDDGPRKTGNVAFDNAVAQLVDYGFTSENAMRGLTESGAGLNVQAAVNWLLDDAHRQAKEQARAKQRGGGGGSSDHPRASDEGRPGGRGRQTGPAWMREDDEEAARRRGSRSPAVLGDGDLAKTAAAIGTNFLKTANSLWKTGQKRMQQAVQEFQQEVDPSQPRWMRHDDMGTPAPPADHSNAQRRGPAALPTAAAPAAAIAATDEAILLEMGARPERKQPHSRPAPPAEPRFREGSQTSSRTQSPAAAGLSSGSTRRGSPAPRWQQGSGSGGGDPRSRLTKQAIEEESAQVYVSSRRRRTPGTPVGAAGAAGTPPPQRTEQAQVQATVQEPPEADLLSNSTALPPRPAQTQSLGSSNGSSAKTSSRPTPTPRPVQSVRTVRPARQVPVINGLVLKASSQHRSAGAAHFKRGDYAAAHASYTASLVDIPRTHPLLAVLYCNRALTALKTGEPRQAVADADAALAVIGPGKGEGESVALEDGTGEMRDLRDLYGKAMTRKAEALEQMEKWADAAVVWQQCVEDGVGGPTAIAGRQRSSAPTGYDSEAVQRLRQANKAAEREDADKLALTDQVDARVARWRDGKKDNLRALLGSMDAVLWEGSGWNKVGLHELVMPNKVKIAYMRAIAKTHPDKLPQDASTEVRMIAGTVFSTLNESWDKFKADNKM